MYGIYDGLERYCSISQSSVRHMMMMLYVFPFANHFVQYIPAWLNKYACGREMLGVLWGTQVLILN